jgi:VWFA-related protein
MQACDTFHAPRMRVATFVFVTMLAGAMGQRAVAQVAGPGPDLPPDWLTSSSGDLHWDEGRIKLDLAITDRGGQPVAGLSEGEITVLDEVQPAKLVTFQAFDGVRTFPESTTHIVFIVDALDMDGEQVAAAKRALRELLLEKSGFLVHSTSTYQLDATGMKLLAPASMSGPDAVKAMDSKRGMRSLSDSGCRADAKRNEIALDSLGSFVLEQRREAGKKVVIWIGPGWPVTTSCGSSGGGFENSFGWVTEFSTRMREARIELSSVSVWAATAWSGDPGDSPEGWQSSGKAEPDDLSLSRLVHQSGGQIFQTGQDLKGMIRRCMRDADVLYTVTFDPPPTLKADEYHKVSVKVARAGLSARTYTGYFNEPVFYDRPAALEQITADQLEAMLGSAQESGDGAFAEKLEHSESTERLSHTTVVEWQARLRGKKSREALEVLSSAASFNDPPRGAIAAREAPTEAEQREILAKMLGYLKNKLPTLPNFFATRTIASYGEFLPRPVSFNVESLHLDQKTELERTGALRIEVPSGQNGSWKTRTGDGVLRATQTEKETIRYRNGKEEVDELSRKSRDHRPMAETLGTVGTFGPILRVVMVDAAPTMQWSRWEQSARGLRAVFRFRVAKEKSHYANGFCCLTDMDGSRSVKWFNGYRGEVVIDPETGDILRIGIQAELEPRAPVNQADIMVAYGPVEIGGNTYICPVRSVAISRKRTLEDIHEWGDSAIVFGPYVTVMNDVTFTDYRKFGSQMRMLPGLIEAPQ